MHAIVILAFVSFFVFLYLSVYSLYLNGRASLNRIFTFYTLTLCVWAFGYGMMLFAPHAEAALLWRRFSSVGYCLFYASFLHFALILTKREKALQKWWLYPLLYFPALLFLVNRITPGTMVASGFSKALGVWVYLPTVTGFWDVGFDFYFFCYTVFALILMIEWAVRSRNPRVVKQTKVIVTTVVVNLALGAFTDIYLPKRGIAIPPFAIIIGLLPACGIWWAVSKNKMLTITPAYAADHILSLMGDPVFVFGLDGRVIFANKAAEKLFGYSREELQALKVEQLCPQPDFNGLMLGEAGLKDLESRVMTKSGDYIPVLASTTVIHNEMGEKAGIVCVLHDISLQKAAEEKLMRVHAELEARVLERTKDLLAANKALEAEIKERRRVETEIRSQEEKLRVLTDNMLDMISRLDSSGNFVYVSPSHRTILGYDPDFLEGKRVFDFVHESDLATVTGLLSPPQLAFCHNGSRIEYRFRHADGHYVWLESVAKNITTGREEAWGAVVCSRDITLRREMEEQLRHFSLFDSLTGLYNRNYFEQEMARMESGRYDPVGVLICDVDGLKLYNDTLGHEAGDKLLMQVAEIIKACFRSSDVVARVGGDEFSVLLPHASMRLLEEASQRVRAAVAAYNEKNSRMLPVSVSMGYSLRDNNNKSMAAVFRQADDYMYREKLHRSQSRRSAVSQIMKKAMAARDFVTEGHAERLEHYVVALAGELGLPEPAICDLRLLAQFHDIGKVGILDRILFKPKKLSESERREMQRHCEIGQRIALSAPDLAPIADWILKHHEWWNGEGYPFGLKGEEIPLECRILAIADAYDAMTSDRPYRKAMPREEALAELKRYSGRQFDPQLVDVFVRLVESGYFDKAETMEA